MFVTEAFQQLIMQVLDVFEYGMAHLLVSLKVLYQVLGYGD